MKFIIAPDSFKESITALHAAEAIEIGILKVFPEAICIKIPMADGGEGTTRALVEATGGVMHAAQVLSPIGERITAEYGILGDQKTAVLEMASASGIHLVPLNQRNPLVTSTYGTGELILAALSHGVEHLLIGIGGSATNDGGSGMIQALGGRLLDQNGTDIATGGGALHTLSTIDLSGIDERLKHTTIRVACDVQNPLTGPLGASAVFGPQKGATSEMVTTLDSNLEHFASIIKCQLHQNVRDIPGSGAAGGLGAGFIAFLNATLTPGIDLVIEYARLEEHLCGADYLFTGEGRIDAQTAYGKTLYGIGSLAKIHSVPVIALAGKIEKGSDIMYTHGITAMFSILPEPCPLAFALQHGYQHLMQTAENVARLIQVSQAQSQEATLNRL